jgi:hypothetical protein
MRPKHSMTCAMAALGALLLGALLLGALPAGAASPAFKIDPYWPKPLPHNWILGQVGGLAVDA